MNKILLVLHNFGHIYQLIQKLIELDDMNPLNTTLGIYSIVMPHKHKSINLFYIQQNKDGCAVDIVMGTLIWH